MRSAVNRMVISSNLIGGVLYLHMACVGSSKRKRKVSDSPIDCHHRIVGYYAGLLIRVLMDSSVRIRVMALQHISLMVKLGPHEA